MVHAQTPSGTENLTRASDLQEYADTIPIHRLQFPHNKSTIVLVYVQTSTFHIRLIETRRLVRTASQSFSAHSATPWSPRGQQIPANEPMSEGELVLGLGAWDSDPAREGTRRDLPVLARDAEHARRIE